MPALRAGKRERSNGFTTGELKDMLEKAGKGAAER